MNKTVMTALTLLSLAAPAVATERDYDRSLEKAAMRIVAEKIGDIRGGFTADQRPVFVAPIDPEQPTLLGAKPGVWSKGIALADEPGRVAPPSF